MDNVEKRPLRKVFNVKHEKRRETMGRYAAPIIRAALIILLVLVICAYTRLLPNHAEEPSAPAAAAYNQEDNETPPQQDQPESATEDPTETWKDLGTFTITAYCPCEICCGYWATIRPRDKYGNPIVYTSTGAIAKAGTTIAVDPDIIPYGSKVNIAGHTYTAQDTGGAINGNRIDVYFDDHQLALQFGVQTAEVLMLTEAN